MNPKTPTNKERLQYELEKAKENLEQQSFFVNWLESSIKLEEIKELGELGK